MCAGFAGCERLSCQSTPSGLNPLVHAGSLVLDWIAHPSFYLCCPLHHVPYDGSLRSLSMRKETGTRGRNTELRHLAIDLPHVDRTFANRSAQFRRHPAFLVAGSCRVLCRHRPQQAMDRVAANLRRADHSRWNKTTEENLQTNPRWTPGAEQELQDLTSPGL